MATELVRPPRKDKKAYRRWYYLTNKEKQLSQSRAWVAANRERKAAICKAYAKAHPEVGYKSNKTWRDKNKGSESLRYKHYRERHHETLKEKERNRAKECYAARRAEILARNKAWRDRNPEYILHQSQKRRALKKQATVNQRQILAWMKAVKSKPRANCYYCKRSVPTDRIHFDHIVALSIGGPHCVENLCVSCADCNLKKGDKPVRAWIRVGQQMLEL